MESNEKHVKNLFEYDEWKLIESKINNLNDDFLISESITSLGNGYFGSRGNFEETYSGKTHQGVYNAGIWFPDKTKVGWWKNGYPLYFGKAINSLNFIPIKVIIDGIELDLNKLPPKKYNRTLDMYNGLLSRQFEVEINDILVTAKVERFYSIYDAETAFIRYSITPNKDCEIKFISILDGDVHNLDSNHCFSFWLPLSSFVQAESQYTTIKTKPNPFEVEQFTVAGSATCKCDGIKNSYAKEFYSELSYVKKVKANEEYFIEKKISIITTKHYSEDALEEECFKKSHLLKNISYDDAKIKHSKKWNERWELSDIKIVGDIASQQGIRFSLFQLFSTFYGEDSNFNIGPKGFTGEKYGGATYWDTEAYCIPLYLSTTPEYVTKSLLQYRYNQLPQAIDNAKSLGLDGALYPMVTFNGVECHNEWEITFEEIHRNGAIAYAIYNYTNYTADESYLKNQGIEVLIQISKFWASRVHFQKEKKVYMIHGVTGPNEFENNVNNNWYTNTIAKWTLDYTISCIHKYKINEKFLNKFGINSKTLKQWTNISKNMYLPFDEEKQVIVQHDGFLDKEFIPTKNLKESDRPIVHHWSWDKILRSCYIKQADVLQGIYLFEDKFTFDEIKSNYDFYEKYTVHESSLSSCIHSILASKIGNVDDALTFYKRSSRLDLDNYNDDTKDGLHITSMAGGWMAIIHGFAGLRIIKGALTINPKISKEWKSYSFNIYFRNNILNFEINKSVVKIILTKGDKLQIKVLNEVINLKFNKIITVKLK